MIDINGQRTRWFSISIALVALSIVAVGVWGLNIGIDFTGGTLMELAFTGERPDAPALVAEMSVLGAERVKVQTAGEHSMIVRGAPFSQEFHEQVVAAFDGRATEVRYELIGPTIGRELTRKTLIAIALALIAIVLYVAWAFRKVSGELASWKYGVVAILALLHDVIIPIGVFAVLGKFLNVEVDAAFIAAALTIIGYSVNDTIIIFDRVRENLATTHGKSFGEIVNLSVNQTFARSLNTTLTTFLALLAVFFFGGASLRYFALALLIGIGVGAYSSIFIAAPLLAVWKERE
ncbi:MAG: protein translocase subunit SecF [bacterium]|nr:protein translocase subunit SecF [bacterium]